MRVVRVEHIQVEEPQNYTFVSPTTLRNVFPISTEEARVRIPQFVATNVGTEPLKPVVPTADTQADIAQPDE